MVKDEIKKFVLSNRKKFEKQLDIPTVKRIYKKREGISVDGSDISDALIELRKEGVLENDLKNMCMKFV